MTLSVIIVNFNVKYFLEQCLFAVQKAASEIETEILVVDNHSSDESINYLQAKFPNVIFIYNDSNIGFARACNIGLSLAKGNYILFLNPDTIIAEDSLSTCIEFFKKHPEAGAIGVQMIDGSGRFLKESKRSFPSPFTSLFKLVGLSKIFPGSKTLGRYHLGHLKRNENHEVDVLAGAFLMIPKTILTKTGGFDEEFFMYGEDVDLSYRIQKAGYKNYYLSETTIIHFKGESTKKGSFNYVRLFYQAMSIFVRKHYNISRARSFNFSIQLAIRIRALLSAISNIFNWLGLPFVDAILILFSFWLTKGIWAHYIRTDIVYPEKLLNISFPVFTIVYLVVAFYAGLYDRYYKSAQILRSTLAAVLVVIAIYSLLPEQYRFSRGMIIFGAIIALLLLNLLRKILIHLKLLPEAAERRKKPYILIVGSHAEYEKVKRFLLKKNKANKVIGRAGFTEEDKDEVCKLNMINNAIYSLQAKEIIFCAGSLTYKEIIRHVQILKGHINIRFHAVDSESIVGSDHNSTRGEVLISEMEFSLNHPANRRIKRLVDIMVSFIGLATFPAHLLFMKRPFNFFSNAWAILAGKKTWIGYSEQEEGLPALKKSVLCTNGQPCVNVKKMPVQSLRLVDCWYASEYDPMLDLRIIWENYKYLGS